MGVYMRLENCCLNVDVAVAAPFVRTQPEEDWVEAEGSRVIPRELFELYRRSGYLSFGAAPPFLSDDDNMLFSYFSMILRCIKESLVDADEQLRLFEEAQSQGYDAGKSIRGETWDKTANQRARRHFKYSLISVQSTLDAIADLTALLFPGMISRLRLGRAQFSRIVEWLEEPAPPRSTISSPQEYFLGKLYGVWRPLVHPERSSTERDWVPLMRLLRNKAAHFGDPVFRTVGLHDKSPKFYEFVPRVWPYIWEQYMKPANQSPKDPNFLPDLLRRTLVHQDIVSFTTGLLAKIREVTAAGFSVLNQAYEQLKDCPINQSALAELQRSSEKHDFEYFQATDS